MKATGVRSPAENDAFFGAASATHRGLPGVVGRRRDVDSARRPVATPARVALHRPHARERRDRNLDRVTLLTIVAPGAFAALGIPLKSGRDFNESDTAERPLVAIVNEALVRKSLPGQNPIGRTIFCSFDRNGSR